MSLANSTADVAMINLVMTGIDGTGVWQDPIQLIPMGMNGDPVDFVARIKASLPLVNNLRVLFNEHSFNADGTLHPQMEAFLAEAVAQGYDLTICYGEGDAQNIGRGIAGWPTLTNAEAFAALQENFTDVSGAWTQMLEWIAAHPAVAQGVWGYELMNESAAYRNTVRANGAGDGLTATDFIKLYADHAVALAQAIDARAEGKIMVGGWGYNGDFASLDQAVMGEATALELIRAGVGADLVWSAHLYPGWMGTNQASSPADLTARLEAVYAPVAADAVLITEINADGQVDDAAQAPDYADFYTASYDWFAARGIGFGWYPGLQTGASHLLSLNGAGVEVYRHQHSLAHALNAFSLGQAAAAPAVAESLGVSLVTAKLRNEAYEMAAGEAEFDTAAQAGLAFGYGANDTLAGTDQSNDFLYGGQGHDVLSGLGADDFLFGQDGDDRLIGAVGADNLFGGQGADRLYGGAGRDHLAGGQGNDLYIVNDALDAVVEHLNEGSDQVQTTLRSYRLGSNLEHLGYTGTSGFSGSGNALANRITGGAGADSLAGYAGNDTLVGGLGNDTLRGGQGADALAGGGGADTASYHTATAAVQVDLTKVLTAAAAGEAAGDSFSSIENLAGSAYADRLWGNAMANTLAGGAGNDMLRGRAGNDQLYGGTGADRFVFAVGDDQDRVRDFENDSDTLYFSGFTGITSAANALAHAGQLGAHVVFEFGAGDTLTVLNTTIAALGNDISIL